MARTRLDEIVEEISGKTPDTNWDYWSPYAVEVFGKIAEACFRHGVERVSEQLLKQPGSLYVQPAPAGESKRLVHRTCSVNGNVYAAEESRKGERRKGVESISLRVSTAGSVRIYKRDGSIWWRDDRRSGKDRRKP